MISYIRVKDGNINIEKMSLRAEKGGFYNGFKITGGNLKVTTGVFGKTYSNVFVQETSVYGIIQENPTILTKGFEL